MRMRRRSKTYDPGTKPKSGLLTGMRNGMWECNYGKEPLDIRLLILRFLRKSPVILLAAFLGAVCIGGTYFLKKVTFGPAKEYEAVTDFYIDYAVQENGEEYTYFNQTTWTQLITDDVFTDRILTYMSGMEISGAEDELQSIPLEDEREWSGPLQDVEKAAGITKRELQGYLYATMLSDTRIVTTTVTTNDLELTMKIEKALIRAMDDFGEEQKEIKEVRILQEPMEASLVIADVRTFRACMLGIVVFVFVTVFYLLIYFVLDEGIHIPVTFERRVGIPMLGTICSRELSVLAERLFAEKSVYCEPVLVTADKTVNLEQVKEALAERGIAATADEKLNGIENYFEALQNKKLLLVVKAGGHNGKQIEKFLGFCKKCDLCVEAALLWEADEKLIRAYEMPEHVLHAWSRLKKDSGRK